MVTKKSKRKVIGHRNTDGSISNADGSVSFKPQVRLKDFDSRTKSFCSADYEPPDAEKPVCWKRDDAVRAAKKAAAAWKEETEKELRELRKQGNARKDLATLTLAQLNKAYLADPTVKTLKYCDEQEHNLGWWDDHYGTCKCMDFGIFQGTEARDALMPGRAAGTVDRYIAAQRRAWNWGREAGYVSKERLWPPGLMLPEPEERKRFLSDAEMAKLLEVAKAHSAVMHTAIVVSIATGVRQSELLRLSWADVSFSQECITVMVAKNGQPRSVHLPATAAAALKALKAAPVVGTWVFVNTRGQPLSWQGLDKSWRRVRKAAKLENFRWHNLRHTTASILVQNGASLPEVAAVLGHQSLQATHRYAHMVCGKAVTGHTALNEKLGGGKAP
jgi:integrase